MSAIKRIGVFTSGGDAPGMNACIRAVVSAAQQYGVEVYGIRYGYKGMIEGEILPLTEHDVSYSLQRGGTLLKSARCGEFMSTEGRQRAYEQIRAQGIDGLVAIGGNGTFTGARKLYEETGMPVVGAPGTIDNDLSGTDFTIGFDTAVNTALDCLDKVRDTADSHDRVFFVEVMGHSCGHIAIHSSIAGGADYVIAPEIASDVSGLLARLSARRDPHRCFLVVVAEGDKAGGTVHDIARQCGQAMPTLDIRVVTLGHIQRGGSPTAEDRLLASRLGVAAVETLVSGEKDVMVGVVNNQVVRTPFLTAIDQQKQLSTDLVRTVMLLCQGSGSV